MFQFRTFDIDNTHDIFWLCSVFL